MLVPPPGGRVKLYVYPVHCTVGEEGVTVGVRVGVLVGEGVAVFVGVTDGVCVTEGVGV